jgi:hypothetical protein
MTVIRVWSAFASLGSFNASPTVRSASAYYDLAGVMICGIALSIKRPAMPKERTMLDNALPAGELL